MDKEQMITDALDDLFKELPNVKNFVLGREAQLISICEALSHSVHHDIQADKLNTLPTKLSITCGPRTKQFVEQVNKLPMDSVEIGILFMTILSVGVHAILTPEELVEKPFIKGIAKKRAAMDKTFEIIKEMVTR